MAGRTARPQSNPPHARSRSRVPHGRRRLACQLPAADPDLLRRGGDRRPALPQARAIGRSRLSRRRHRHRPVDPRRHQGPRRDPQHGRDRRGAAALPRRARTAAGAALFDAQGHSRHGPGADGAQRRRHRAFRLVVRPFRGGRGRCRRGTGTVGDLDRAAAAPGTGRRQRALRPANFLDPPVPGHGDRLRRWRCCRCSPPPAARRPAARCGRSPASASRSSPWC